MQDLVRGNAGDLERALEVRRGGLVGADVLSGHDCVDRRLDVLQRVLDDVAVGVRDDYEPQPRVTCTS